MASTRSASPSCAIPISAFSAFTFAFILSKCVDPQLSLIFKPFGVFEIAITSAPARRYASGATIEEAPFAQSTTTLIPVNFVFTEESKCVK
ncbi:unannotated protein [freshwater metagenome]|uniref:Unannotated protein n=1 Tax=freshwater metagenome TaxID=449393 RepID=A0A6J6SKZ7_9ZZZZ